MEREIEIVSKIEAAERQLRVAIRMFFELKDMLAVHTLAAAAQGLLIDLGRLRGYKSLFEHDLIPPECRDDLRRAFRSAQNFFKHADKDPAGKLPFFPEATKFFLFDAALLDYMITRDMSPEILYFVGWFLQKHPHFFDTDACPQLANAILLAEVLNFDDFDCVLAAIDQALRRF